MNDVPQPNYLEGFKPNERAVMAYLITPMTGILFFIVDKDPFVRFHAFQSMLLGVFYFCLFWSVQFTKLILIGFLLEPFALIIIAVSWFWIMWKAYNNQQTKLPVIGFITEVELSKRKNG